MTLKKGIISVLKMPTIYAVSLAILLKITSIDITNIPAWPALVFLRYGLIPVSLITFGAQLAKSKINLKMKTPYLATICRLIGGPVIAFLLIHLFGFDGIMAKAILIASSTPTAIQTALLSIETKGDVDFAVQTVTISTLLSAITMAATVYIAFIIF